MRKKVKPAGVYWQKIWVCGYLKNATSAVCKEDNLHGNACATGLKGRSAPGMANIRPHFVRCCIGFCASFLPTGAGRYPAAPWPGQAPWALTSRGNLPSPQPSPHGRGSSLAAIEGTSPLLWGEGQGEGRYPRSSRHPLILAAIPGKPGHDNRDYCNALRGVSASVRSYGPRLRRGKVRARSGGVEWR